MTSIPHIKLVSAVKECESHRNKLVRCMGLLASFFPLSMESFTALDEMQLEHIDQFIYRFTKLQDAMGIRLYPAIYAIIEQDGRARPFIDMFARLEKYGIVGNANTWQFFRNLRNSLAHEYPESLETTMQTLNILFSRWADFEQFYTLAKEYLDSRGLLLEESTM